jgi:hypothetical protein
MNEAGTAKNIANYASYISIVTTFGTVYKPPLALIEVAALQSKLSDFEGGKDSVTPKASAETIALNERQALFEQLSALITRVVAAAAVSVNDQLFSNDLRTIARKAQGRRVTQKVKDDPATPDIDESKQSISSS